MPSFGRLAHGLRGACLQVPEAGRRVIAAPPRRGVVDHVRSWRFEPLTPSVAPRTLRLRLPPDATALATPGPSPPHPRQRAQLPRPRTPSTDECSRQPTFANHAGTRHRSRGFATGESASDTSSPRQRSRVARLDPPSNSRALRSRARRATCRSSTSAIESRSTSTTDGRPNPGHRRRVASTGSTMLPGGRTRVAHSQPSGHGPGARVAFAVPAPSGAIARARSFAPTRSP